MTGIFIECATTILLLTIFVFMVGRAMHKSIGRDSEMRRIHGWYVLGWATAGYFIGGCIGLSRLRPDNHQYFHEFGGGMAGFGLLIGLMVGTIHGGIVLLYRVRQSPRHPEAKS